MSPATREPSLLAQAWRYDLLALGGRGATSDVWRAHDRVSSREIALKIGRGSESVRWLWAEAERLALVGSPFVPELLDVGTVPDGTGHGLVPGSPYLALSWAAGQPLGGLSPASAGERRALALAVARDVGSALADLHDAGVAHGDLKPDNVRITTSSSGPRGSHPLFRATVVDLGLSGDADAREVHGGTPRYLPPELWEGTERGDARSRDRFALGLMLAEIVQPDLARSDHLARDARAAKLPHPWSEWCGALLSPEPGARPRAAWLVGSARAASGFEEPEREKVERRLRTVRASYLASRRIEIAFAARGAGALTSVDGAAGDWLRAAIGLARRAERLRGEVPDGEAAAVGDATPAVRSRWLVALVGAEAAGWPLSTFASGSDADWSALLLALSTRAEPRSFTLVEVLRARSSGRVTSARTPAAPSPLGAPVDVALALSQPDTRDAALEAIERGLEVPVALRRAAAETLRRMGETGRAWALVMNDDDVAAAPLRAEIARRAGDRDTAAREAARAPGDERAAAVIARLAIDRGEPAAALESLAPLPQSVATLEARVIALALLGRRAEAGAELSVAEALATSEEARGRVAGLAGYMAHENGDTRRALSEYARAAEHAQRAGALAEEATYLSGQAAAAVYEGDIGRALAASHRAVLLWQHLGRPKDGARALLARAAALATVGAAEEATSTAEEARERARWLGDKRAEAYACWAVTDARTVGDAKASAAARDAFALLADSGIDDDRLRALARLLRHVPSDVEPRLVAWADGAAAAETTLVAARLEWWTARALSWLEGHGTGRREVPVTEICQLVGQRAPIESRGPAFAAGAALAARAGDGQAMRLLSRAQNDCARDLLALVPADLRDSAARVGWVAGAPSIEPPDVTSEQITDFEVLVRSLGQRDRLRPLLDQVLDTLVLWTGVERGMLLLPAPNGKLVPRAARNLAKDDLRGEQLMLSHSLAHKAIEMREPVVAVDAAGDMPSLHASVHALKLRSVLAIPLIARGQVLGVVYLDDRIRRGAFGPKELAWVRLVASLASLAIADARDQILLRRAARRAERAKRDLGLELARREVELDVLGRELSRARDASGTRFCYDAIIGRSAPMQQMLRLTDRVTVSDVPVLLMGESGSGKELIARAIHANGPRASRTFVAENCSAIPEPLLESTLFGHTRGAFTGADRPRAGLFEVANHGTLFLDEIGEMSLAMQSKLLRVLQDGEVRALGSDRGRTVDVRIIAATHRDLTELVKAGRFREDLFYRLDVIAVRVPPLRERKDDIALLVHHFLGKHGAGRKIRVSSEAMARLIAYEWPGNVRQLENEIRRVIVLSDGVVERSHLSSDIQHPGEGAKRHVGLHVRERIDALEADLVKSALSQTSGNQTRAAEVLGLSRFGLQKMMKRLGI